jgi:hypothetical protein
MIKRKPLELPPKVARGFVSAKNDDRCSLPFGTRHFAAPQGRGRVDPREGKNGPDKR